MLYKLVKEKFKPGEWWEAATYKYKAKPFPKTYIKAEHETDDDATTYIVSRSFYYNYPQGFFNDAALGEHDHISETAYGFRFDLHYNGRVYCGEMEDTMSRAYDSLVSKIPEEVMNDLKSDLEPPKRGPLELLCKKVCRECRSSDISYVNVEILNQKVTITYGCNDCGRTWTEIHSCKE